LVASPPIGSKLGAKGDSGGPVVRFFGVSFIAEGIFFAEKPHLGPFDTAEILFSKLTDIAGDVGAFTVF
jgi:hypothetical protein